MKKIPAPILVILAAICWGLIGLFTRTLSAHHMSVLQMTFARAAVTLIGSFFIILFTNREYFKVEIKDLWLFFCTGVISIVLFNTCYFLTIEQTTLSVAAILLYTAPCFVVIFSAVLFKQKVTGKMAAALILSFIGCVLTTGLIGSKTSISPFGILTGVLSGLFYGLYSIFGTIILRKYKTPTLVFYVFLFATLGLLPFIGLGSFIKLLSDQTVLINTLCIGLISTLAPYFLYSEGLSRMPAGKASIIAFIEPLTATIVGILVFHEPLTIINGLGIALIFFATILLNTDKT